MARAIEGYSQRKSPQLSLSGSVLVPIDGVWKSRGRTTVTSSLSEISTKICIADWTSSLRRCSMGQSAKTGFFRLHGYIFFLFVCFCLFFYIYRWYMVFSLTNNLAKAFESELVCLFVWCVFFFMLQKMRYNIPPLSFQYQSILGYYIWV